MNRITSLIFDLDGTLYDSSALADEIHRQAVTGLALQLGVEPAEADRRLHAAKAAITARSDGEATLSAAALELGCSLKKLHDHLAGQVNPAPFIVKDERVVAMLQRLRKKFDLYLYTNNNRTLARAIMRITALEGLFTTVFTIEDFWRAKPDRTALAGIFAAIGAEPGECLFIGDRYAVDLRLPEELGSMTFLTKTVNELLTLEEFCNTI